MNRKLAQGFAAEFGPNRKEMMLEKPLALLVLLRALMPALALAGGRAYAVALIGVIGLFTAAPASAQPAPGTVGSECDPYDPSPGVHSGVACQAVGGWTRDDAVVMNARKGDLLLNSKCGPTLQLVSLAREQGISHVGIMIQDRREIRHARVALRPMTDSLDPSGADRDLMRFGWPGVLTQKIRHAFEGNEWREKPSHSVSLTPDMIQLDSHFGSDPLPSTDPSMDEPAIPPATCEDDVQLVDPILLRPPPEIEAEDPAVRANLHLVAEAAKGLTGHYRFYAFTKADIHHVETGLPGANALPGNAFWKEPGHPDGRDHPLGMQCASFIWHSAREAELTVDNGLSHLESPWELYDGGMPDGAELVHADPEDEVPGLYKYREEDRHKGISFLGTTAAAEVAKIIAKMPWGAGVGAGWARVAGKVMRQIQYCFAFDDCRDPVYKYCNDLGFFAGDDYHACVSEQYGSYLNRVVAGDWGEGLTVSPGDITHWDAPPNGLWGAPADRLIYRPTIYRQRHEWLPSAGHGSLAVTVTRGVSGDPIVPAANVTLTLPTSAAEPRNEVTDSGGEATFDHAAQGTFELQAFYNTGGGVEKVKLRDVTILAGAETPFEWNLDTDPSYTASALDCPPDGVRVVLSGTVKLTDHECCTANEVETFTLDQFLHSFDGDSEHPSDDLFEDGAVVVSPGPGGGHGFGFGGFGDDEEEFYREPCVDEVGTNGELLLEWADDDGPGVGAPYVRANLQAWLNEAVVCGWKVNGIDAEDTGSAQVDVLNGGGPVELELSLYNSGFGGGDRAKFSLTLESNSCPPPLGGSSP